MEIFIYLILTAIWWVISLSVLLPFLVLLLISETVKDKWLTFIFLKVCGPRFGPKFVPMRKQLFKLLEEHLSKRNKSVPLKMLEIGVGGGANLQFYPENSSLTALDKTPPTLFDKNRKKFPHVNLDGIVVNYAEDMKEVPSGVFDVVVSMHVLCSVTSVDSVMKEVKRVLKPGGKFLFMEHVAFPKTQASYYIIQLFATPLWAIYFDGCFLNRNITDSIKKAGFRDVHCEHTYIPFLPIFFRPHISGIATL
ncbi:thiol S-methyltransferase TMT1A [Parasteatoda tepidariorum]|uniref:thiol S-methyltransferase TMT1A n=1 Tax=Parasteatoda tepidariorum TaxID=114398 RepID=UPI00077FAC69|nr:methyltransferase-like protein 7A [Parasteatoda tepidariorum]XP_042903358.1 methyltransferase-like protein 7A [Parasteatoda tepidariorum]